MDCYTVLVNNQTIVDMSKMLKGVIVKLVFTTLAETYKNPDYRMDLDILNKFYT